MGRHVDPVMLAGEFLTGTLASGGVRLGGPCQGRFDELLLSLRVSIPTTPPLTAELSAVP